MNTTPAVPGTVPETIFEQIQKAVSFLKQAQQDENDSLTQLEKAITHMEQLQAQNKKDLDRITERMNAFTAFCDFRSRAEESSHKAARRRKIFSLLDFLTECLANISLDSSPYAKPIWFSNGMDENEDNIECHIAQIPVNYTTLPPGTSSSKTKAVSQDANDATVSRDIDREKFTLFPSLVIELRIAIWMRALPGPRILEVTLCDDRLVMAIDSHVPIISLNSTCSESREVVLGRYQQVPSAALGLRGLPPMSRIPVDIRTDVLNINNVPFAYLVLRAEPSQLLSKLTTIAFDLELFGCLLNGPQNAAIAPLLAALGGMQRLKKIIIEVKGCDHVSSMTIGQMSHVLFLTFTKTPPSKECEGILASFRHVSKQNSILKSLRSVELVFVESRRTDLRLASSARAVTSVDPYWFFPIAPVISSST